MEGVGKQCGHVMEMVNRAFLTSEDDLYRMTELLLILEQHLATAAARGDRFLERFVRIDGRDDDFVKGHFGIHGRSSESGDTLRTESAREDRILLVGTGDYLAIVHQDGRSDLKMRVFRIRVGGCFFRLMQQFQQILRQFLATVIHLHLGFQCYRLHIFFAKYQTAKIHNI